MFCKMMVLLSLDFNFTKRIIGSNSRIKILYSIEFFETIDWFDKSDCSVEIKKKILNQLKLNHNRVNVFVKSIALKMWES